PSLSLEPATTLLKRETATLTRAIATTAPRSATASAARCSRDGEHVHYNGTRGVRRVAVRPEIDDGAAPARRTRDPDATRTWRVDPGGTHTPRDNRDERLALPRWR